ncbi:MAG: amidohydrolase family protein [Betaproteobacteria bacterium]|nr:amidohydrolase family protein [Betaproteobacteria bacterium]
MQTFTRIHNPPSQALPANATDCHMHVFGPFDRFPLAAERSYTVPEAPLDAHERMKCQVGLERTVFVQASGHGLDNRALLAALAQLGSRARAVAVVAPDASRAELERLHAAGVRGARLNLYSLAGRYADDPAQLVAQFAKTLAPLAWHLQLLIDAPTMVALEPVLARSPIDIVIDHMGLPDARDGIEQSGFQVMRRLLRGGRAWAKLAGADRITRHTGRLRDAIPFMQALADAALDRLVWGSDWPNIGFHSSQQVADDHLLAHRELDAGELLELLIEALPDARHREIVLARNPATLYGFG